MFDRTKGKEREKERPVWPVISDASIHRYPADEPPVKPAIRAAGSRTGWVRDIHVFKFIYWQDFCPGEGVVGRGKGRTGPDRPPFLLPLPSIFQPAVKPLPGSTSPSGVIFPLKEISANYAACPTAVEF